MPTLFANVRTAHRALDYHLQRHNVLASNVANVDTPGFRPLELLRESGAEGPEGSLRVAQTNEGHFALPGQGPAGPTGVARERVIQPGGDHNSVSLEREMAKVSANDMRFEAVGRFVRQHIGMLRYAASDGQGG